jgi:GR25 family glycosyltransferase involved in LPS biosynthesis
MVKNKWNRILICEDDIEPNRKINEVFKEGIKEIMKDGYKNLYKGLP